MLGLDLIWEKEHPALMVLLASVNPFTLWQYGLLGAGISTICRFTAMRSAGVLGLYWVLTSAFGAGIAWVGHAVTGGQHEDSRFTIDRGAAVTHCGR